MQLKDALAARGQAVSTAEIAATWSEERAFTRGAFPPDARAIIHCPAPSAASAGRRRAAEWVLEFERRARPFIEPLMGWTGGADPLAHVRLRFPSCEAAVRYAERQGLAYEVREPVHIRPGDLARTQRIVGENAPSLEPSWVLEASHLASDPAGLAATDCAV